MTRHIHRRRYGDGAIDGRAPGVWRLRYRVNGRRFTVTFHGTRIEAQRELRRRLKSGDDGEHIAPSRHTLAAWSEQWLMLLSRGEANNGQRKRGLVTPRTKERYSELLRLYILPELGGRSLQALTPTEIDNVYIKLEQRISITTVRHAHIALRSCLATAVRKGHLARNPADAADVPRVQEKEVGQILEPDEMRRLLEGFRGSPLYLIVATALFTGARLGEVLALRWSDLDPAAKMLRIERTIETTAEYGRVLKEPKSARGKRTIMLDNALIALLLDERERYLRLAAGIPDGERSSVDLSLVKLPPDASIFASPVAPFGFARSRNPRGVTKEARERFRRLGFARLRFHDLRASHGTALLVAGVPVHVVAARLGHDPAMLLRRYAKRTPKADAAAAAAIAALSRGVL